MKRFLKKMVILFLLLIVVLYGIFFIQKDIVWKITNAIGMDAKLCYAREKKAENLDIIAVGSSMTLNNLNSEIIVQSLPKVERYFNYGAWGMTISDTKAVLENLLQTSEPESVIVVSNIVDFFGESESRYSGHDLKNYMDGCLWNDVLLALKYAFPHNLETIKNYEAYQKEQDDYTSLAFDDYGGVALQVYGENINEERWNTVLETGTVTEAQYEKLEELCDFLGKRGITLYFVQSPFRAHYLNGKGAEEYMEEHRKRCRQILESNKQYYYDATDLAKYTDSLFSDYIHLNKEGSQTFTEEFMIYYNAREVGRNQ